MGRSAWGAKRLASVQFARLTRADGAEACVWACAAAAATRVSAATRATVRGDIGGWGEGAGREQAPGLRALGGRRWCARPGLHVRVFSGALNGAPDPATSP